MAATAGEDVALYSNLRVARQPPSPSDDPYQLNNSRNSRHSRPVRKGTARPTSGTNTTTKEYPSAAEVDGLHLHPGSMSSLHLSLHSVDGPVNNRTSLRDQLRVSGSNLSGYELSRPHSRQQGHREEDSHSVNTTHTPPTRYLAADIPYSRFASDSHASLSTGRSLVRSIAASESRQAAYRTHEGLVNSRPVSIRGSVAGSHRGSPVIASTPLDLPQALPGSDPVINSPLDLPQALPGSDPVIDPHVHYTAPPSSGGQPGSEVILFDGPPITAMVANDVRRYERPKHRIPDVCMNTVPAMTIKFRPHDMVIPEGWVTLVHPEGARYFVNEAHRTFTEMNVCDEEICGDIEYYMQYLLDELQLVIEGGNIELDMQQIDLVIEPKVFNGDSVVCCYYFVNHRDRCLFWLDECNVKEILTDCVGVESLSHIQIAVQGQYWRHWDYFPSLCLVTESLVDEVKDMLIHATCDQLTSVQSSAAFDKVLLKDHLEVVDKIKVYPAEEQSMQRCHAAIVIGRIMFTFCHNHFINFHGENCVRLSCDQSAHGWKYAPSPLMLTVAPLLFFDPVTQVQELHKVFVDQIACKTRWDAFSLKLKEQVQDSNLLATVLLNANVGFLAINSVDGSGRSIIQMASYMSLVTSLGSIVLGLAFVSRDRTSAHHTATETARYLSKFHEKAHGLEKLAIIYSLPKALLMWGMVFFFTAFSIHWASPGDVASITIVGVGILVVSVMVSYGIVRTWDGDLRWWRPKLNFLHGGIHRVLLSHLAGPREKFMEFVGMKEGRGDPTREPQSDAERFIVASMGTHASLPQAHIEANVPMHNISHSSSDAPGFQPERPGPHDHENSIIQPSTPVDSPLPLHDGTSMLLSSNSRTNPGVLTSIGGLQQIQENAPTTFQSQSIAEGRCEPDGNHATMDMHFTMSPYSASEGLVGNSDPSTTANNTPDPGQQIEAIAIDPGPLISIGPICAEERVSVKYSEHVVEEPGEFKHPRPSSSSTPPPRIIAKSATADYFHHAPVAPRWTLEDGYDIEECRE